MDERCQPLERALAAHNCGARYVNHFEVGYSGQEVLLNLGQRYETGEQPAIHTRLVTTPAYARVLSEVLAQALHDYEAEYGAIPALPDHPEL